MGRSLCEADMVEECWSGSPTQYLKWKVQNTIGLVWSVMYSPIILRCRSYYHADTEYFLQLQRLKSKPQVVSNIGLRVVCYYSGELFHLHAAGHFSLTKTLLVSAHILSLWATGGCVKVYPLYNVCSVHQGMFSTSRDVQYIKGCSVHRGDIMSRSGDIMSASGDVQYIRGILWWMWEIPWVHRGMFSTLEGYHEYIGGYHEYIRGCSVHRRDIMIHVGEQLDKILSISIENSDVLNIPWCTEHPRCTHDIPLKYSWYRPMYSLYPPDVLMVSPTCIMVSPTCIMISPDILNISRCTHDIPPMYSWYPSDVLNIPRSTHGIPLMYWTPPMYSWYPPMFPWYPPMFPWYPPMCWTSPNVLNTHYKGWFKSHLL